MGWPSISGITDRRVEHATTDPVPNPCIGGKAQPKHGGYVRDLQQAGPGRRGTRANGGAQRDILLLIRRLRRDVPEEEKHGCAEVFPDHGDDMAPAGVAQRRKDPVRPLAAGAEVGRLQHHGLLDDERGVHVVPCPVHLKVSSWNGHLDVLAAWLALFEENGPG